MHGYICFLKFIFQWIFFVKFIVDAKNLTWIKVFKTNIRSYKTKLLGQSRVGFYLKTQCNALLNLFQDSFVHHWTIECPIFVLNSSIFIYFSSNCLQRNLCLHSKTVGLYMNIDGAIYTRFLCGLIVAKRNCKKRDKREIDRRVLGYNFTKFVFVEQIVFVLHFVKHKDKFTWHAEEKRIFRVKNFCSCISESFDCRKWGS